jgi:hypothetical protein
MRTNDGVDERFRRVVEKALEDTVACPVARTASVEAVMTALESTHGAAATRRRYLADLKAALKDGFRMGQKASRFDRWHDSIWSWSMTNRTIAKSRQGAVSQERLSRFNDV